MGVPIASTITVVNRSGKVVKTSKHLNNLFQDAKSAYLEKKAELKATRDDEFERKLARIEASDAGHSTHTSSTATVRPHRRPERHGERREERERASPYSSRHSSRRSSPDYSHSTSTLDERRSSSRASNTTRIERGHYSSRASNATRIERGHSDSLNINNEPSHQFFSRSSRSNTTTPLTASNLRHSQSSSTTSGASSTSSLDRTELTRRRSDSDAIRSSTVGSSTIRPRSPIDPALAYGDLPPPLPVRHTAEEDELREKMTGLQRILQEANCVQHSAKAVMKNLENDPDAMAAVALTLAEISKIVTKMGPVALTAMKGSFPMIVALLLSPEFLIAGGVALGVTVVSFGGYKIVKRIKAGQAKKNALLESGEDGEIKEADPQEELEELGHLDRIEQWRRGIAFDPETASVGTSVEGEYATPGASKQLREEGVLANKTLRKDQGKDKKDKPKEGELEKKAREKMEKDRKAADKDKKSQEKREKAEKPQKQVTYREKAEEAKTEISTTASATASTIRALFKKEKEPRGEVIA